MNPLLTPTIMARLPTGSALPGDLTLKGNVNRKKMEARLRQLFTDRQQWETRWKEIRDFQNPWAGMFGDTADESDPARRRDLRMIDGTPYLAATVAAAGIMAGLTPPSRPWFRLTLEDKVLSDDVRMRRWLDDVQDVLYSAMSKSNFYNAVHSVYLELPFGQGPMSIMPHIENGVTCKPYTIGTYVLDVGADGMVNTFGYKYKMTTLQLVEKFGLENCPRTIQEEYRRDNCSNNKHTVCWLIEPNDNRMTFKVGAKHMAFRSVYWVEGSDENEVLYAGGFRKFPIPVARWHVLGLMPYGIGPGWFAEGDAKMLQVQYGDINDAVALGVRPPVKATEGAVAYGVNMVPGGITIVDDTKANSVDPLYQVNLNIRDARELTNETRERINKYYSANLFMMLDQLDKGQMTAREVIERSQEKLQILGPVVERMQYEFLSPIVERYFDILAQAGALPPLPPELPEAAGQEIKLEYTSPLAQAQKMSGLTAIEQGVAFVAQIAQVSPDTIKKVDWMEAADRYLDMLGVPAAMVRPDEQVQEEIEAERQAVQQQQAMQAMAEYAQPVSQAVKNVSEVAGNPAMNAWLGLPNGGM